MKNLQSLDPSIDGRDWWAAMATLYQHADQIFNTTKGNVWGAEYLDTHPNGLYECMVKDSMELESLHGDLSALISRRQQDKMTLYITAERLEAMCMPVLNHRRQQEIAAGDFEIDYERGLRIVSEGMDLITPVAFKPEGRIGSRLPQRYREATSAVNAPVLANLYARRGVLISRRLAATIKDLHLQNFSWERSKVASF
jgi:hypothetical protein